MRFPLDTLVYPREKIVTIPAFTEIDVVMNLTMPPVSFDGIILGAFKVVALTPDGTIAVDFDYNLHVRLTNSQHQPPIPPDFRLANIRPQTGERFAALQLYIRNPVPALFLRSTVTTELIKETEVLRTDVRRVCFAPNGRFALAVVHNAGLEIGPYLVRVTVTSEEGDELFHREQGFVITEINPHYDDYIAELSSQIRSVSPGPEAPPMQKSCWLLLFLPILALLFILWIILRKKKQRQKEKNVVAQPTTSNPALQTGFPVAKTGFGFSSTQLSVVSQPATTYRKSVKKIKIER
jgi:hypothetical protein